MDIVEGEIIGGNINPSLQDLNKKGIQKLYTLIDSLDAKSEPEMVRACIESLAKLNSSLKGSDVFAPEETEEERRQKAKVRVAEEILRGKNT